MKHISKRLHPQLCEKKIKVQLSDVEPNKAPAKIDGEKISGASQSILEVLWKKFDRNSCLKGNSTS